MTDRQKEKEWYGQKDLKTDKQLDRQADIVGLTNMHIYTIPF